MNEIILYQAENNQTQVETHFDSVIANRCRLFDTCIQHGAIKEKRSKYRLNIIILMQLFL